MIEGWTRQGLEHCTRAVLPAALALALVQGLVPGAEAGEHSYDQDNQFGAVSINERDQGLYPRFDRSQTLGASPVSGQDRSAYQPDGIRIGNYLVLPEAGLLTLYDKNPIGGPKGQPDWRNEFSAGIKLASSLPRHLLDFAVAGRYVTYQGDAERNFADGGASLQTRIDITHAHALVGNFVTRINHEERATGETPLTAKTGAEFWQSDADVGFVRTSGRLTSLVGAAGQHREFRALKLNDGTHLDQSYRDTDTYEAYLKLRYQISPGYTLTGRVSGIREQNRGNEKINRSNMGYEATTGLDLELTRLLKARLEAGYTQRDFTMDALADINSSIFEGRLAWLVTPLVTLSLRGRRTINSTGFANASGRVDSLLSFTVEHELLRNLVLNGMLEYTNSDFIGSTRQDTGWFARVGADYYLNKNIHFSLMYEHQVLTSNEGGYSYENDKVMAAIKFKY